MRKQAVFRRDLIALCPWDAPESEMLAALQLLLTKEELDAVLHLHACPPVGGTTLFMDAMYAVTDLIPF